MYMTEEQRKIYVLLCITGRECEATEFREKCEREAVEQGSKKRRSKVRKAIAIDFDGCLFEAAWPTVGEPILDVIQAAIREKQNGAALILWTCRVGQPLSEAIEACRQYGLEFDAVNANLLERLQAYGADCRKVEADEYWDDRAVVMSKAQESFTLDQVAMILFEAFQDGCPCNYNGNDEWLPMVCRFCKSDDCPDPPDKLDCWREFIRQRNNKPKEDA